MAVACSGGTNRSSGSTCRAHRPRLTALIPYTTTGDTIAVGVAIRLATLLTDPRDSGSCPRGPQSACLLHRS